MDFRAYLAFAGKCRDAFTRYQQIFGGELMVLSMGDAPPEAAPPPGTNLDAVMHASLTTPEGGLLMGADDPTGNFSGTVNGMCVNIAFTDAGETKRVFDALSAGGIVQQPLGETFFTPGFGMCTDRFGTPWMVMVDTPPPS